MWIKPGQHGTSARSSSGHHHSPTRKQPADDLRSVLQRQTASPPPADQGTGTLAHPWKNGP